MLVVSGAAEERRDCGSSAGSRGGAWVRCARARGGVAAVSAGAGPAGAAPAAAGGSASGSPVQAVEQFYKAAAAHQYATAWALADPNLRSQVGGYSAFRNEMSSVRSVTFDRAAQLADSSPTTATVAVQTTSVQTSQTQHCSGTVQTVHNGGGWLLDRLSIGC